MDKLEEKIKEMREACADETFKKLDKTLNDGEICSQVEQLPSPKTPKLDPEKIEGGGIKI